MAEAEADNQASSAQQWAPDRAAWVTRHAGARESADVQNTGCWMPDTMLVVIRVDTPY
ncbi:MAG TPA: hypothetical protein VII16_17720 [Actinomycetes bacterium]